MQNFKNAKGKLEMRNFTREDDDTMEAMYKDEIYRYLGHMQSTQIKHAQMKQKLGEEYIHRTKTVLKTKLNGKNTIKAINTYATPVPTFSFGIVKWTPADLENLQTKTRALLTRYRFHHLRAAKERLTVQRQMCGTVLIDITGLHDKQVKLLHTYFSNKQVTSPLHAAVIKADYRYTPLDLVRENENDLITDEEYNNIKRQWSQKALHGRHPCDLSQQYVDIEASNKWLTNADLLAETEGFLTAKQDQVIPRRNYNKYISKQPNINEVCRRCGKESETIQHITAACEQLAPTEYVKRHDGLAKVIHQKLAETG
jgi:hypothetical protein